MGALRWISVLGVGVGLTLTACGDDDDSDAGTTGGSEQTVSVKALDSLKFDPDQLTATAGVILTGCQAGSLPHELTRKSMELLAREVIPRLRGQEAGDRSQESGTPEPARGGR